MPDRRCRLDTDFLFQCLDQHLHLMFASRRHPDGHPAERSIHRGDHGHSVIGFKNKFQKGDPATIDPVILRNGI